MAKTREQVVGAVGRTRRFATIFHHQPRSQPMFPRICNPLAYDHFTRQLPRLETTEGLLNAAVAISLHAFDTTDVQEVEGHLRGLAARVRAGARRDNDEALLAHLHHVLFEEEGYHGTVDGYYHPLSSFLPMVLLTKRGIPISLTLVYKLVGDYAGLKIEGVNAPGHFLARVTAQGDTMLIDPFDGGRVLTEDEAYQRFECCLRRKLPRDPAFLSACSHQEWIDRLLSNLRFMCERGSFEYDLNAFEELQLALVQTDGEQQGSC